MTIDTVAGGLRLAVEDVAGLLESKEARLLESELQDRVLQALLQREDAYEPARSQHHISLKGWSGSLGPVDLVLRDPSGGTAAAIELKSTVDATGGNLADCAWDVVKLGQGIAEEAFPRGFVVAAASQQAWKEGVGGSELFEKRDFDLREHLRNYEGRFEFWRRDVENFPRRLPFKWRAFPIGSSFFSRAGVMWELRASEISPIAASVKVIYVPKVIGEEGDAVDPQVEDAILKRFNEG